MTQCSNAPSGRLSKHGVHLGLFCCSAVFNTVYAPSQCRACINQAAPRPSRVHPPRALNAGNDRKPHLQNLKSLAVLADGVRTRSCKALERILCITERILCITGSRPREPLAAGARNTLPGNNKSLEKNTRNRGRRSVSALCDACVDVYVHAAHASRILTCTRVCVYMQTEQNPALDACRVHPNGWQMSKQMCEPTRTHILHTNHPPTTRRRQRDTHAYRPNAEGVW